MKRVTLTFDNGPTPGVTDRVLDILARRGLRATFFVIGQKLDDPAALGLVEAAHAAGHWIGNHTLTHTVALGDRPDRAYAEREIDGAQARLGRLARPEKLFRPYGNDGLIGPHLLSAAALDILLAGRYRGVLWTSVPGDWKDAEGWVDTGLAHVAAQDWTVTVLHDIPGACLDRLPEFLDRLERLGVRFEQEIPDSVVLTSDGRTVSLDPSYVADAGTPMTRLPYADRATAPADHQALFDRLEAERGKPVENIFLSLAREPDLCEAVLGLAMTLRQKTLIDRRFRELAVLTVGLETGSTYEVDHHWNSAVKAGVRHEQLEQLAAFETADVFTTEERAVMRYAREVTVAGPVTDATWATLCTFLDERQRMELVLTVAWYNCVVRILLPLQIEREAWFKQL